MFQVDVGSGGDARDLAGQPVEVLLYNGYTFVGPFRAPLTLRPSPPGKPLVAFDQGCEQSATYLQDITPTMPFTHTHWLGGYDTVTRTFTITATSSQGWAYTYYYGRQGQPLQQAPGLPFMGEVGPGTSGSWPRPPGVRISAVCTPTIPATSTVWETFTLRAMSVVSPAVQAEISSAALAPGYQLDEGGFRLYLPLVLRQY